MLFCNCHTWWLLLHPLPNPILLLFMWWLIAAFLVVASWLWPIFATSCCCGICNHQLIDCCHPYWDPCCHPALLLHSHWWLVLFLLLLTNCTCSFCPSWLFVAATSTCRNIATTNPGMTKSDTGHLVQRKSGTGSLVQRKSCTWCLVISKESMAFPSRTGTT